MARFAARGQRCEVRLTVFGGTTRCPDRLHTDRYALDAGGEAVLCDVSARSRSDSARAREGEEPGPVDAAACEAS
jgi:hypothetical protein